MHALADQLKATVRGKVCVVGVGNRMRGDDGVGSLLIDRLPARHRDRGIDAGMTPENYLGKVARLAPDTVVMVDAVDFGADPGAVRVLDPRALPEGSLSTHALSLGMAAEYLDRRMGAKVVLVGIQPGSVDLGEALSPAVGRALESVALALDAVLCGDDVEA
jgi:hydrogenase 3 maturation protease